MSLMVFPPLAFMTLLALVGPSGPTDGFPPIAPVPSAPARDQRARKTWTAADLARLANGRGLSIMADAPATPADPSQEAIAPLPTDEATPGGAELLASAPPAPIDWAGSARSLQQIIGIGENRMEAIDTIREQWTAFVLATGQHQAAAAHELGALREERLTWEDAVRRARADLLALEEAARKAGVAPGELR